MARFAKGKRRRYAAPIGGLFMFLALVGVITMVVWAVGFTGHLLDNQSSKQQIEDLIRPVLMWDPPPFENPADISPVLMLQFSMWSVLMDENTSLSVNENMEITVPASDLDVAATRMFGPGIELRHRTFGEFEQSYYFDHARRIYHVPPGVQLFLYSPRVVSIERSGEFYYALVGYIPPAAFTANIHGARGEQEPEKHMLYVMRRVGGNFQIVALRDDPAVVHLHLHE